MASKSITINNYETELPGKIDENDNKTYVFPQIISNNARGKSTFWKIYVRLIKEDKFIPIKTEYFNNEPIDNVIGYIKTESHIGQDGKIKEVSPTYIKEGKNLFKKNKTNVFTQALRDALSKYNKQKLKKEETINDNTDIDNNNEAKISQNILYPPMLAKKKIDLKKSIKYPAYVQRKLDGVRCVMFLQDEKIIAYSRNKKIYEGFDYIKDEIKQLSIIIQKQKNIKTIYWDGEIYKHGVALQTISGQARKNIKNNQNINQDKYEYHIYDIFDPNQPNLVFKDRLNIINYIDKNKDNFPEFKYIKFEETYLVSSDDEVNILYDKFLKEQYEGAMLRLNEPYTYSYNGYKSSVLLKLKPDEDAEFVIYDYTAGTAGIAAGALMFILVTPAGKKFTINMAGVSWDYLKDLYKKMNVIETNGKTHFENHYKGKQLTIKFDAYSSDGVPVRARTHGIIIRDYE